MIQRFETALELGSAVGSMWEWALESLWATGPEREWQLAQVSRLVVVCLWEEVQLSDRHQVSERRPV